MNEGERDFRGSLFQRTIDEGKREATKCMQGSGQECDQHGLGAKTMTNKEQGRRDSNKEKCSGMLSPTRHPKSAQTRGTPPAQERLTIKKQFRVNDSGDNNWEE